MRKQATRGGNHHASEVEEDGDSDGGRPARRNPRSRLAARHAHGEIKTKAIRLRPRREKPREQPKETMRRAPSREATRTKSPDRRLKTPSLGKPLRTRVGRRVTARTSRRPGRAVRTPADQDRETPPRREPSPIGTTGLPRPRPSITTRGIRPSITMRSTRPFTTMRL